MNFEKNEEPNKPKITLGHFFKAPTIVDYVLFPPEAILLLDILQIAMFWILDLLKWRDKKWLRVLYIWCPMYMHTRGSFERLQLLFR